MKFWQLMSIFRDEQDLLFNTFSKNQWNKYLEFYNSYENLVFEQNRTVLDSLIESELLEEIALLSKKAVYLLEYENKIFSYYVANSLKISIERAIQLFSHNSIEEVFEKSEALI